MNAMRSMCLVPLVFLFCLSACGAANSNKKDATVDILGQLDKSEMDVSEAQSAEQAAINKVKEAEGATRAAQGVSDAAAAARLRAAQIYAGNLEQAAKVREAQAREYREKICKYDPGRCGGPGNPAVRDPVAPNVGGREKIGGEFVDLKIASFADGGFSRFTSYPPNWTVTFKQTKFVLLVGDVEKASLSDPNAVGKCYRVVPGEFQAITCPQ